MKTLKITAMVLGLATLASCGGSSGLDDATNDAIAAFDSSWAAMMNDADAWVSHAKDDVAQWEKDHAAMDAMVATWDQKTKDAQAANIATCSATSATGNSIIESAETSISSWKVEGAAWGEWKKQAEDGDISQEDATAALADWNAKLQAAHDAMASWTQQWTDLKTNHETAKAQIEGVTM